MRSIHNCVNTYMNDHLSMDCKHTRTHARTHARKRATRLAPSPPCYLSPALVPLSVSIVSVYIYGLALGILGILVHLVQARPPRPPSSSLVLRAPPPNAPSLGVAREVEARTCPCKPIKSRWARVLLDATCIYIYIYIYISYVLVQSSTDRVFLYVSECVYARAHAHVRACVRACVRVRVLLS